MKTWKVELFVVALVMSSVVVLTKAPAIEWVGAAAVTAGFAHGQVADRLTEREAARERPSVPCHRLAARYWCAKELAWLVYFAACGRWSALAGVVVFALYPLWRVVWRRAHPLPTEVA